MKKIKDMDLKNQLPFIIAEIGNNHQGSIETAKKMIKAAKDCGASAVKLQKRNNKKLYTKHLYNQVYDNKNGYGTTYGEHREFLEFGKKEYMELKNYAESLDIIFFATPFDFDSVDFLEEIGVPCYKIASADLVNTPLQKYIAKQDKQIFLSTGGGTIKDIIRACETILSINKKLCVLHCTMSYPTDISDMNLNVIPKLIKQFPELIIGIFDHQHGIDSATIAYMLGARVFEKHFTLNHSWAGTDHSFSFMPEGLRKLIRNINRIPKMLGDGNKQLLESEKKPLKKMGKSIVAIANLPKGHKLTEKDIALKSPSGGLPPYEMDNILGKSLKKELLEDEMVTKDAIE